MFKDIKILIQAKNKRLTAKFMTAIENNNIEALNHLKEFYFNNSTSFILGVTGLPGAGKSTLINNLIKHYRSISLTVGVIAIDPSSSFTGGAFLGDRVRMNDFFLDENVFIRSMASKGKLGGVAPSTSKFIKILEMYGCDIILVETTGTGQSEIEINHLVDTVIVVNIPGTGDLVQSMKAGILEIADIFVINKADLEGKDKLRLLLEQLIEIEISNNSNAWIPPIVETISIKSNLEKSGVKELAVKILDHRKFIAKPENKEKINKERIRLEFIAILKESLFLKADLLIRSRRFEDYLEKLLNKENDPISLVDQMINDTFD